MPIEWVLLARTLHIDQYQYRWISLVLYLVSKVSVKSGISTPLLALHSYIVKKKMRRYSKCNNLILSNSNSAKATTTC